jgi:hypothetical protein
MFNVTMKSLFYEIWGEDSSHEDGPQTRQDGEPLLYNMSKKLNS